MANPAVCAILEPVQLSAEVGSTHVTSAPQTPASVFTDMFAGKSTMVGASLSVTVTVKLAEKVLELASVAVYVIVVTPAGNVAPLANPAVCAILEPAQLSAEVGSTHVTSAPQTPASLFTDISAGILSIVGFSSSVTVMFIEQVAVLFEASVTVQVTTVVPTG